MLCEGRRAGKEFDVVERDGAGLADPRTTPERLPIPLGVLLRRFFCFTTVFKHFKGVKLRRFPVIFPIRKYKLVSNGFLKFWSKSTFSIKITLWIKMPCMTDHELQHAFKLVKRKHEPPTTKVVCPFTLSNWFERTNIDAIHVRKPMLGMRRDCDYICSRIAGIICEKPKKMDARTRLLV